MLFICSNFIHKILKFIDIALKPVISDVLLLNHNA